MLRRSTRLGEGRQTFEDVAAVASGASNMTSRSRTTIRPDRALPISRVPGEGGPQVEAAVQRIPSGAGSSGRVGISVDARARRNRVKGREPETQGKPFSAGRRRAPSARGKSASAGSAVTGPPMTFVRAPIAGSRRCPGRTISGTQPRRSPPPDERSGGGGLPSSRSSVEATDSRVRPGRRCTSRRGTDRTRGRRGPHPLHRREACRQGLLGHQRPRTPRPATRSNW